MLNHLERAEPAGGVIVDTPLTVAESERVLSAMADSRAPSTRRAYASKWKAWETWCDAHGRTALPAEPVHVAAYLAELADAGRALSTINGSAAAIRAYHEDAGADDPTALAGVRRARAGLSRQLGSAPRQRAHAVTLTELKRMLATCDDDGVRGVRDRAVLLLGYAGAMRRSELAALEVRDIGKVRDGLAVTIRKSKGDQTGEGQIVGITRGSHRETCPVTALASWLDVVGAEASDPIFCRITRHNTVPVTLRSISGEAIDQIVQARAERAGLGDLAISGHSLRAGHATAAAEAGVDAARIARTTRHARLETLAAYVRPAEVLRDTTAREIGL